MTMENSDEVSFQERTSSDNSFIDEIHLIFKKGEWGGIHIQQLRFIY